MNSSVQAATVWNIRNLLIGAVALLSLLGLAVSGYVLRNASLERATASDAASVNEVADLLLESAGQWARERGATNLALNAANPAADAQVAFPQGSFGTMGIHANDRGEFTVGLARAGWWGVCALNVGPTKEHEGKPLSQDAVIWVQVRDMK